ncbi:MAG TPA: MMPL family transporter [Bacillota bacterium]|nr:MMPL family transporter [Bacillota bacterium]
MKNGLHWMTDRVTTKKGVWITLGIWIGVTLLLTLFAPSAKDYEVSRIASLPDDAQSVIAQNKQDHYFKDHDGTPGLLVFQETESEINRDELFDLLHIIQEEKIDGIEDMIPLENLPPQAMDTFFSEDDTTALVPITFDSSLETKELRTTQEKIYQIADEHTAEGKLFITGPAGIAVDSLNLFSRADLVLLLSTIGIILLLLILIYRSPFLAFIPLLAAVFVYGVVNQILGLLGKAGVPLSNQSLSIMTILLFATVIDYSLFVFSRYREELKNYEDKHDAMRWAMRGAGLPVFYSGATVFVAMLVLFFAEFGDYYNFAPIFGTTLVVVMLSSVTLVPALFTILGRRAFWPKIPRVGEETIKRNSLWSKIGRFVTKKPILSIVVIGMFLLVSASNVFNINYEFNTMKSFPEDMPSREGYELLEDKFAKGELAPTTVLFEAAEKMSKEQQKKLINELTEQPLVSKVRLRDVANDGKVTSYQMTFEENPYAVETIDSLEAIQNQAADIIDASGVSGSLYFSGETATAVDDRSVNNRDVIVIVLLETVFIFTMLIFLTKSLRMPLYMMGTILVSFVAALGLGMLLSKWLFGIDTISNRVPLYSFVFLVALGIDYNIILISRFLEERKKHPLKKAVEVAVSTTGGVISSAGIILAATFAVLMTQPIQLLFVFGFIVAIGILLDTFLIRGILLPSLLVVFEKEQTVEKQS